MSSPGCGRQSSFTCCAEEWEKISAAFDKKKYQMSAARWRLRGLPIETAIRKVQVDREVGHNIAEKRSRREWDDDEWEDDEWEDDE